MKLSVRKKREQRTKMHQNHQMMRVTTQKSSLIYTYIFIPNCVNTYICEPLFENLLGPPPLILDIDDINDDLESDEYSSDESDEPLLIWRPKT
jgi:hypothetical protein